ncbi:cellobiose phosphorylase [Metabacillus litoralis]|uniref:Cellobiose phosphorylase n=1 Tax=Metabacillus litoralis TaxID=152268 RepID=A0A5C6W0A8_9BACI|nr:cellobiose phosphorylase [Metabacillus litoralis]TXC91083.1 cellobiose phosphorylase [Metabacillus litoralis]
MKNYYFDEKKRMVIEDYDKAKTFSSFLPGVAGIKGVPMWTFYVNRGQGISSFGVRDKHSPIMEFSPANIAYKNVSTTGFRTFIKLNDRKMVYEPFQPTLNKKIKRKMYIEANQISIEEVNEELGLSTVIEYFNMPEESFAGLVRKVQIRNLTKKQLNIEVLDGMPEVLPYGVENQLYKEMGNLLRSWMEVYNLNNKIPYYHVRASIGDEAEVNEVKEGHFFLTFSNDEKIISPIVDTEIIFGSDHSLLNPENFVKKPLEDLVEKLQVTANKVPCAFTPIQKSIGEEEAIEIFSIIGHVSNIDLINNRVNDLVNVDYINQKQLLANRLIRQLTDKINTKTGSEMFDEYARQSYLDNFLRGGYPYLLDNKKDGFVYHLFSRKHGDQERDYNFFSIAPEYFSQGNGNFRDMNQNRRNDIYFEPAVGSFNTKMFMSLIQADGYNPLLVKGCSFEIAANQQAQLKELIKEHVQSHQEQIINLLDSKFTPGQLINYIANENVQLTIDDQAFLTDILSISQQNIEAGFGEGFWVDHWTYNLDLVESYLDVYPDHFVDFMFKDKSYKYFDSPAYVLPRSEKFVLSKGNVRQFGSVIEDKEKMSKLGIAINDTNWLRIENGSGEVYHTTLFVKLLSLSLMKFVTLDPLGIGVEMEANKPGWNDAMNGLPGLIGSGISETFELRRIVEFLLTTTEEYKNNQVDVPVEYAELLEGTSGLVDQYFKGNVDDFHYWDQVASMRESFREKIRFGINGEESRLSLSELKGVYKNFLNKIDLGIKRAEELGEGLYPTYLSYEVNEFDVLENNLSQYGLPKVKIYGFSNPTVLPYFLEGPARALKAISDQDKAKTIYQKVKKSDLFDKNIKMYKTSVSLDNESFEIGRIKAFTPGWLERESVFLHMSYKYLLEVLKSGLYDEYFNDIQTSLIPFLDPETYGRSTLENSSFIASSVNPDPSVHGRGFIARLSGSTAEFLSMWKMMMIGKKTFHISEGQLVLTLSPNLPSWMFDESGRASFTFLGDTKVTYYNTERKNTYGTDKVEVKSFNLKYKDGSSKKIESSIVVNEDAKAIRNGEIKEIDIELC